MWLKEESWGARSEMPASPPLTHPPLASRPSGLAEGWFARLRRSCNQQLLGRWPQGTGSAELSARIVAGQSAELQGFPSRGH